MRSTPFPSSSTGHAPSSAHQAPAETKVRAPASARLGDGTGNGGGGGGYFTARGGQPGVRTRIRAALEAEGQDVTGCHTTWQLSRVPRPVSGVPSHPVSPRVSCQQELGTPYPALQFTARGLLHPGKPSHQEKCPREVQFTRSQRKAAPSVRLSCSDPTAFSADIIRV